MTSGYGMIVAAYVVVAVILLGLGLYAPRWPGAVRIGAIVVVAAAYIVVYDSLPMMLGWPADRAVPAKFNLLAVYIQDPDRATGAPGHVFFWATDAATPGDPRPRAFRLPFTPEIKTVFQEAQGKLSQNIPQEGETELDDEPNGVPLDRSRIGQESVKIKIRDAPVGLTPSKDVQR